MRLALLSLALSVVMAANLAAAGSFAHAGSDATSLAQHAIATRRFERARKIYLKLLSRNPSNVTYLIWSARLSGWTRHYGDALRLYDRVLAIQRNDLEALVGKANVLIWSGRLSEAAQILAQAREINPHDGDLKQATLSYQRALKANSEQGKAAVQPGAPASTTVTYLENQAKAAAAQKRFALARDLYDQLSQRFPRNADYPIESARFSAYLGEYSRAQAGYERALALQPDNVDAMTGKAYVLMYQHRYRDALPLLEGAETRAPANVDVLMAFARFYHYQDRDLRAAAYLHRALAAAPNDSEALSLSSELVTPHPWELTTHYQYDNFSFTDPGHAGFVSFGYRTRPVQAFLNYEVWDRFAARDQRGGLNLVVRAADGTFLRGGFMWGPGATVIAREDYTVGVSQALPGGLVLGADYRHLHFAAADVELAEPSLEYYFSFPVWLRFGFYQTWTAFGGSHTVSNQSYIYQYNHQIFGPLTIHVGYANGTESFSDLTVDKLGQFSADTYTGAIDLRLSERYLVQALYAFQRRSGGAEQQIVNVGLTFRP